MRGREREKIFYRRNTFFFSSEGQTWNVIHHHRRAHPLQKKYKAVDQPNDAISKGVNYFPFKGKNKICFFFLGGGVKLFKYLLYLRRPKHLTAVSLLVWRHSVRHTAAVLKNHPFREVPNLCFPPPFLLSLLLGTRSLKFSRVVTLVRRRGRMNLFFGVVPQGSVIGAHPSFFSPDIHLLLCFRGSWTEEGTV